MKVSTPLNSPAATAAAAVPLWGRTYRTEDKTSFQLRTGSARVYRRAEDIDAEIWSAAFGGSHKDFEYYRLLEETMNGQFTYRYLVIFDPQENPIALQPLILVDQDLAASTRSITARAITRIRTWQPRFLRARMLLAGCLVGEAEPGMIGPADPKRAAAALAEALLKHAREQCISLITVKDFPGTFRDQLSPLVRAGYTRLSGFPPLMVDLGFDSFDEYMTTRLSKVTRKGLRRKFRNSERATPPITFEVLEDCSDVIDDIYPLYLNVALRSHVTFEVFTKEYFLEAGRRMPGRFRYFIWRQHGKAIAFSFCTVWKDTIYDNDIGLDYGVAYDLNLYFLTFRDLINWALKNQLKYYRSGPFHYDPKLHLRLKLVDVDLYVKHLSPVLNAIIKVAAPFFAPTRSDPVLRNHLRRSKS